MKQAITKDHIFEMSRISTSIETEVDWGLAGAGERAGVNRS
jgi:hypothetical protein